MLCSKHKNFKLLWKKNIKNHHKKARRCRVCALKALSKIHLSTVSRDKLQILPSWALFRHLLPLHFHLSHLLPLFSISTLLTLHNLHTTLHFVALHLTPLCMQCISFRILSNYSSFAFCAFSISY